jgi:DNA excision repair protein ERCC-2
MALRVELEARRIQGSIGDLALELREGPRGVGLLARVRAEVGSRVHAAVRAEREAGPPGYRAELPVQLRLQVDGFEVELGGRIDGLFEGPDHLMVEEVKSLTLGGAELHRVRAESFPDFCLQLRLYCLALEEGRRANPTLAGLPELPLRARLLLVSLLDGSRREIALAPEPASTRGQLEALLRRAVARARASAARNEALAALAGRLRFPYPTLRPHQAELLEAIESGLAHGQPVLAMAPTGIGKTITALLGGLRFALGRGARLAYLTSKTTQQPMVERTFEDLCRAADLERGELRALTLRAKEGMCPPGHLLCHPDICPYLEDFQARLEGGQAVDQLLAGCARIDPDMVRAVGEAHRLCPYALQLAVLPQVEVVIGDYNYVFDPGVALLELIGEERTRNLVAVVDEAHNLFDRARGYYSPFLARSALAELQSALDRGEFLARVDRTDQLALEGVQSTVDGQALFTGLRGFVQALDEAVLAEARAAELAERAALENCRVAEPDIQGWLRLGDRAGELLIPYVLYNRTHRLVRRPDPVLALLHTVGRLRDVLKLGGREFAAYAAYPGAPAGAGFGVLCANPASRLQARHEELEGCVALSATLAPLGYFADVLGFAPLAPLNLDLPSPFARENLGVFVLPQVKTAFRARARYHEPIARLIEQTCAARPGRYAAYFPSYQFLADVRRHLGPATGQILVQDPGMPAGLRQRLLDRFRASRGACLLAAVMGGAFSEGVDLPGEELLGAVVVGPGLPQVGFERAVMRAYFEAEYEHGFAYAMLYPGLQRVIQAAGRVIRTPEDRGVIVLADERFAQAHVGACLPSHWYRHEPAELVTEDLPAALEAFWSGRRA